MRFARAARRGVVDPSFVAVVALILATTSVMDCKVRTQKTAEAQACTLVVQTEPAQGISILLDGTKVAIRSPYVNAQLAAGDHVLQVRGMGRYPVDLPLRLQAGQRLDVPVTLRQRPPLAYQEPGPDAAPRAGQTPAGLAGAPGAAGQTPMGLKVRPSPAARAKAPLPAGASPLRIAVEPTPSQTVVVDGQAYPPGPVRLGYGQGALQVGPMQLSYRVYPGRGVELTVPHEPAAWFLGPQQIKAKSLVRLSASPIVLRRQAADGAQQIWMRRLD